MKAQDLSGRAAVISGGWGDIGLAIGLALGRCGAKVSLGDIGPEPAREAALEAGRKAGVALECIRVDTTDERAVRAWLDGVRERLGPVRLVIPNAAIVTVGSLREIGLEAWRRELDVNLNGAFLLGVEAARRMAAEGVSGRIVFIGSWAAHRVHAHIPAYGVAKAGLRMLVRTMAAEFARDDILVNEVAPGFVDAGLSGRFYEEDPARREASLRRVPVGRLIEPEEVAAEVLHLCDPANRHMTGATVLMDGGLSL
ncbi:MAG: SDR family oxidoreductase [Puniceicoccaceae bacterium]|nr:MAG: SDR family oxidoreductase [Puniceicoccaceae bacterium]